MFANYQVLKYHLSKGSLLARIEESLSQFETLFMQMSKDIVRTKFAKLNPCTPYTTPLQPLFIRNPPAPALQLLDIKESMRSL